MPLAIPDLVVVGHISRDVVPEPPGWRPGGSVFYAASAAARLGASVGVVTAGGREVEALRALPNTMVVSLDVKRSTSFENVYRPDGRRQYLRALAPPIAPEMIPLEWHDAPAVLLAPIADEVSPAAVRLFARALTGVSPQGWMRQLAAGQEVRFKPWLRAEETLAQVATAIFSEEDVRGHSAPWLGYCGPVLVTTRGELGCDLVHCGKRRHVPGFPAAEVDPTGAGDVFAAAYMLRLRETRDPVASARFANCVASFSVAGPGVASLPALDQVQDRLAAA